MGDTTQRAKRRSHGEANYRLVRYPDDFVICVAGRPAPRRGARRRNRAGHPAARPRALAREDPCDPHRRGHRVPRLAHQASARTRSPTARLHLPVQAVASGRDGEGQADHAVGLQPAARPAPAPSEPGAQVAGAPTSKAGSPRAPSATCAPTPGGGSFAGCAGNTARRTGAGSGAATPRGDGRPTARRCSSTPAPCGPPATATGPRTSRLRGKTAPSPCASRPCPSNAWTDRSPDDHRHARGEPGARRRARRGRRAGRGNGPAERLDTAPRPDPTPFATTAAARRWPPSRPCSASAPGTRPRPAARSPNTQPDRPHGANRICRRTYFRTSSSDRAGRGSLEAGGDEKRFQRLATPALVVPQLCLWQS
jgi:hypothetical protein